MQGKDRGADKENNIVDTGGDGEGGTNWRVALTYIHYHV